MTTLYLGTMLPGTSTKVMLMALQRSPGTVHNLGKAKFHPIASLGFPAASSYFILKSLQRALLRSSPSPRQ